MTRSSLLPREHGAWGQLFVPLVTALVLAPSAASGLFALGAAGAFLSYEPLLVVLGHRGPRARTDDGPRARRRFLLLALVAAVSMTAAILLAGQGVMLALAVPAVPTALVGILFLAGRNPTARSSASLPPPTGRIGELLASLALPAASVPAAVAGGASTDVTTSLAAAWPAGFASLTLAVRAVVDQGVSSSPAPRRPLAALLIGAIWAVTAAAVAAAWLPAASLAGLTPLSAAALGVLAAFPRPQRLRVLGWSAVAASLLSAGALVATLS